MLKRKILPEDIRDFFLELALLLKHGFGVKEAVEISGEDLEKPAMRRLLQEVKNDLAQGTGLADSLAKHPAYFYPFLVERIRAAEAAGNLEQELRGIVVYQENLEQMDFKNAHIKRALVYPVSVLLFAFLISAVLMIFVVPVFADMFGSFGARLPLLTQMLINLSNVFVSYWFLILAGLVLIWVFFKYGARRSESSYTLLMRLPVFGSLYRSIALSRILQTWVFMLARGAKLPEAVRASAQVMDNVFFNRLFTQLEQDLHKDTRFDTALERHAHFFPRKLIRAARVGAAAREYETLLASLAEVYKTKTQHKIQGLGKPLGMFLIIILAIIIGSLVIGMYLPIFVMGAVI